MKRPMRSTLLLLASLVSLGCERSAPAVSRDAAACRADATDSAAYARVARDTIARLRAEPQTVVRITPSSTGGVELRTEDASPEAFHDGGLVAFDCTGRVTLVWLDGG